MNSHEPHKLIGHVQEGCAKGIALRMGCSNAWVYRQADEADACIYTRFLSYFFALEAETPEGAEILWEDFRSRVLARREKRGPGQANWTDAVAKVIEETSQAIRQVVLDRDPVRTKKELAEAIGEMRKLMALVESRQPRNELSAVS